MFDLDSPRFSQSQVLDLVQGLSSGVLQNWVARGTFQSSADTQKNAHAKRKWTLTDVFVLQVIVDLRCWGISPTEAFRLGKEASHFLNLIRPLASDLISVEIAAGTTEITSLARAVAEYPQHSMHFSPEMAASEKDPKHAFHRVLVHAGNFELTSFPADAVGEAVERHAWRSAGAEISFSAIELPTATIFYHLLNVLIALVGVENA